MDKSAAPPVPNFPRLLALALFGRRPANPAGRLVIPASKNLHNSGHLRRHDRLSDGKFLMLRCLHELGHTLVQVREAVRRRRLWTQTLIEYFGRPSRANPSARLGQRAMEINSGRRRARRFDGVFSMDVLLFVADKRAALKEVARILKPGGRFVGTSWELRNASAALPAPAFEEYPGAFKDAGFTIEVYEDTRDWRNLLTYALGALVASEDAIRQEVEGPAAAWLLAWARARPPELEHSRRVRFCVQRSM